MEQQGLLNDTADNVGDNADVMSGDWLDQDDGLDVFSDSGGGVGRKRDRSNAKAVECSDLAGNIIEVFPSGLACSLKMNVTQSDISQCCRGIKPSFNGYRFRFVEGPEDKREVKLKRGYGYVTESVAAPVAMRTTRASRGEYQIRPEDLRPPVLPPPDVKTRKFLLSTVSIGPFSIRKWLPDLPAPTAALQEHRKAEGAGARKGNKSGAAASVSAYMRRKSMLAAREQQ